MKKYDLMDLSHVEVVRGDDVSEVVLKMENALLEGVCGLLWGEGGEGLQLEGFLVRKVIHIKTDYLSSITIRKSWSENK